MANTKSAQKNARKARVRMLKNRQVKSRLKTLERQFQACLEGNDEEAARKASAEFISALDRAAKSSIIHRNKASRKKSACAKQLSSGASNATVANAKTQESPKEEVQETAEEEVQETTEEEVAEEPQVAEES